MLDAIVAEGAGDEIGVDRAILISFRERLGEMVGPVGTEVKG